LVQSSDTDGTPAHTTASTILGGSGFQEGNRLAKDKVERYTWEGSTKNGTPLGGSKGSSSQQKRLASESTWMWA